MRIKIVSALFCVVFPFLSLQAQAQSLRRPVAPPSVHKYSLVCLWVPDTLHPRRSHWRWVLYHGLDKIPHIDVEVKSLDAPPLIAYIKRLPSGSTIGMAWQFKYTDLAHQASLAGLQRLCTSRRIGFDILHLEPDLSNLTVRHGR